MAAAPWAILFDLDGTLVDTVELLLRSMRHAFADYPRRAPTDAEWVAGIGTPLAAQLGTFVESPEEIAVLLGRYRAYQLHHHDALTRVFPDVPETLRLLRARGHAMAVVTSKADTLAKRGLAHVGLTEYVDVVVGCDSTSRHKPHPEPVHHALAQLRADPSRALFVGDSPHDMAAGHAAGVATAAALWGPFTRAEMARSNPSAFLNAVGELPALIANLTGGGGRRG